MPFTLKSAAATAAHAMAQGDEEFRDEDGESGMGSGADKPLRTDDAEKASQRHPVSGRFVSDQTAYGAAHGPLTAAVAQHPGPAPLASLTTTPAVSLGSSLAPGEVTVTRLDYRTNGAPRPNAVPLQPVPHQAPNSR